MTLPTEIAGAPLELGAAELRLPCAPVRIGTEDGPLLIEADRDRAFVQVADVGRFVISGGNHVEMHVTDPVTVGAWLHGTITALLLAQRERFALHASVVEIDGVGVALTGPQRAGKSTTALCLASRGHRLISDDVAPLQLQGASVVLEPTRRPLHLWPDAAERLGVDVSGAVLAAVGYEKLTLPLPPSGPLRVGAIVALNQEPARWTGPRAAAVIFANAYRVGMLRVVWGSELMQWAAGLAERLTVVGVARPPGDWTADAVADSVEAAVAR